MDLSLRWSHVQRGIITPDNAAAALNASFQVEREVTELQSHCGCYIHIHQALSLYTTDFGSNEKNMNEIKKLDDFDLISTVLFYRHKHSIQAANQAMKHCTDHYDTSVLNAHI